MIMFLASKLHVLVEGSEYTVNVTTILVGFFGFEYDLC